MKLKYVGLKQSETAFRDETGITWTPGSAYEVPDAMASRMLKHPDVFAPAQAMPRPVATPAPTAAPTQAPSAAPVDPAAITLAPAPAIAPGVAIAPADPLAGLDDAGLRAFAKERGLKINGIALTKGENLRAKVAAALAAKG